MAYAYTVNFPSDGIIGVYSTMRKAECAIQDWIKEHNYDFVVDTITKEKEYQTIWFDGGFYAEIDRFWIL